MRLNRFISKFISLGDHIIIHIWRGAFFYTSITVVKISSYTDNNVIMLHNNNKTFYKRRVSLQTLVLA